MSKDRTETPAKPGPAKPGTIRLTLAADDDSGARIGHYKLLQKIGEGGCGVVYMAEQEEPVRRRVALKIIKLGMDTKSVIARFEAERQALALMDHPNIARVLDAGATDTGRPFFAMELVRGIRITDYCDQHLLPTAERLALFIHICHAIQHAHQKGIIHRDLKPSNILVTLHDGTPVPKVIDFGIAKATEARLTDKTLFTAYEQFIGTPAYMSPEQAEMSGLDIDTRSDIYSLGVLLYEMLTGHTPFDAKQLVSLGIDEMRRVIREEEPARPSTRLLDMDEAEMTTAAKARQSEPAKLASLVRGDLDWIVMKAIEKDRTRRYATANEFALDLQRYLRDEPVTARPPSAVYRLRKFARRNKLAFAVASAFATALAIGLALFGWQFLEKNRAYGRLVVAEREQRLSLEEARQAREAEAGLRIQAERQEQATRQKAYVADINLAQQALAAGNFGRAQALLNAQVPADGRDLRGWEWRYLSQLCQSDALFTLCQQSNEIASLSVSRDGKWVALGETGEAGVSVWDLRSRERIAHLPAGEGRGQVAFSPTTSWLAFTVQEAPAPGTRTRDSHVQLWDAAMREVVGALAVSGRCRRVIFSEDGQTLLTINEDNDCVAWNLADQTKQVSRLADTRRRPGPPTSRSLRVDLGRAATRDLSLAAYAEADGQLTVMDLATGTKRWSAKAANEAVTALAFSPDGKTLASGAGLVETDITLWDVASGQETGRLQGHRGWICALLFWPDGKTLASASGDQTIGLWNLETRQRKASLRGHGQEVWALALLPDQATLVSGSKDGSVNVWDAATRRQDRSRITLGATVRAWRFAQDSQSLVTVDARGRVDRWPGPDFQQPQKLCEIGQPEAIRLSQDARFAATPTRGRGLAVWDLEKAVVVKEMATEGRMTVPLMFLPGNRLALGRPTELEVTIWDFVKDETSVWKLPSSVGLRFAGADVSADGQQLLLVNNDGTGRLLDLPTGKERPVPLGLRQPQPGQIAFSPDSQRFAVASVLGTGSLWETSSLRQLGTFEGFLQGMHSVAFSPDGRRLAIGSNGHEAVKLWDVETQGELLTLAGEGSVFSTTAFSPDGKILGASNAQGTLHLWPVP